MKDELYYPSNGSEGSQFMDTYCQNCTKDTTFRGGDTACLILTKSMINTQVRQWIYKDGIPTCTSFVKVGSVKRKPVNIPNQIELL